MLSVSIGELFERDGAGRAYACAAAAFDTFVRVDYIYIACRDSFSGAFSCARAASDTNILINFVSHFFVYLSVVENLRKYK